MFEIRRWNLDTPESLRGLIGHVNRIRRDNPALQSDHRLRFHPTTNDRLLAFSKSSGKDGETILVVVNLDPFHTHSGWLEWPAEEFLQRPGRAYQMHDLLTDNRYLWTGRRNFVRLDPQVSPAHVFRLRRKIGSERNIDHFM